MNENGVGVAVNKVKSIEWYQKAASQGHKDAIEALSKLKATAQVGSTINQK